MSSKKRVGSGLEISVGRELGEVGEVGEAIARLLNSMNLVKNNNKKRSKTKKWRSQTIRYLD